MDNKTDDEFLKKIEMENQVARARGECSHQKPKAVLLLNQTPSNSQHRLAFLVTPPNIAYSRVPSSPCPRNITFLTLQETVSTPPEQASVSSHLRNSSVPMPHNFLALSSPGLSHFTLDESISKRIPETAPSVSNGPTQALNLEYSPSLPPISLTSTSTGPQLYVAPSYIQETDSRSHEATISTVSDINSSSSTGQTSSGPRRSSSSRSRRSCASHRSTSSRSKRTSSHGSISPRSKGTSSSRGSSLHYLQKRTSPANHCPASSYSWESYLPMSRKISASNSGDLFHSNFETPTSENSLETVPFSSHRPILALNLKPSTLLLPISLSSASPASQPQADPSQSQETNLNSQGNPTYTVNNAKSSGSTEQTSSGSRKSPLSQLKRTFYSHGSTSSHLKRVSSLHESTSSHSERISFPHDNISSYSQGRSSPTNYGPASSQSQKPMSHELLASNSQESLHFNLDGPSVENPVGNAASVSHGTIMALNLDQSAPLPPMALTSALRAPQTQAPSYIQEADSHSREVTTSTVSKVNYFGSAGQTSSVSQRSTSLPPLGIPYSATHAPASPHLLETHLSTSSELSTSSSQGLSQVNLEEPVSSYLLESTPSGSLGSLPPIASTSGSVPQVENRTASDDRVRKILSRSQPEEPHPVFVRPRPVQVPRPRTYNRSVYRPYPPLQPPRSHCLTDIYLDMDTTLFPELYM